jgi:hypothetical protein
MGIIEAAAANVATIIGQSIISPFKTTQVNIRSTRRVATPRTEPVGPPYKLALLLVFLLTIGSLAGQAYLATLWTGDLTPLQGKVVESLGFGWQAGFGAIVGLLGGKVA